MKNRFPQLQRNLYKIKLLQTIVKPEILVICDKYELLCPFFNCYQIPQLNCKYKILSVSPQRMTMLVKIKLTRRDKWRKVFSH